MSGFQVLIQQKVEKALKKKLWNMIRCWTHLNINSTYDQVCLWPEWGFKYQGWYAEFLLNIVLQFVLGKTGARFNLKIMLISLHIYPNATLHLNLNFVWFQKHSKAEIQFCVACGYSNKNAKSLEYHVKLMGPYHNDQCVTCGAKVNSWQDHQVIT